MNNIKEGFSFYVFIFMNLSLSFSIVYYHIKNFSLPVVVIGTGTQAREPAAAPSMLSLCRFE